MIELMIVVAIIGILAAVALPAFQNYSKRAKIAEVVLAASACRTPITEAYQSSTTTPAVDGWGCEASSQASKYVASVHTDANGVVTVTAAGTGDSSIDGMKIQLVPYADATTPATFATAMGQPIYKWVCGPTPTSGIPLQYLPGSCRG